MFFYSAFGLSIESEIEIGEFIPINHDVSPSLNIKYGRFSLPPGQIRFVGRKFFPFEGGVVMYWRGIGAFLVKGGSSITIMPDKKHNRSGLIRSVLLGPALGMILYQRQQQLLFHSSVVGKLDGLGAISFMAKKSGGKSSMGTAMCNRGYSLVSDDLLVINHQTPPQVQPGFPGMKLWLESAQSLVKDGQDLPMIGQKGEFEKRTRSMADNFINETLPLGSVFILEYGEVTEPAIERLTEKEAFLDLLPHWYGALFKGQLLPILGYDRHIKECSLLIKTTGIYRLVRPYDLDKIDQVVDLVDNFRNQ